MNHSVVIHKEKKSDYGVTVPDLPGCFSAGRTLDEALAMAKEAIELHLEGLIESGSPIPKSLPIEQHQHNPDYKDGVWAIVYIDPASLRIHARRVNITIPERILDAIDRAAAAQHDTRSGLLTKAATTYIQKHRTTTKPKPKLKPRTSRFR
jgi:predicted RNase H-like HicB family nuclease